jgi:protein arginine kinase activator
MGQENFERPIECGECKKPVKVCYTEIVGKNVYRLYHCDDCPVLRKKLYGQKMASEVQKGKPTSMCCGGCGLTLDEIQMGSSLGCSLCYGLFSDEIYHQLFQLDKLPPKAKALKKGASLYTGRAPGEEQKLDPSLKLLALKEALHETLGREDYEQAAYLRDEIKAIEETSKKEQGDERKDT